jgi:hypothetical protein
MVLPYTYILGMWIHYNYTHRVDRVSELAYDNRIVAYLTHKITKHKRYSYTPMTTHYLTRIITGMLSANGLYAMCMHLQCNQQQVHYCSPDSSMIDQQ